MTSIKRFAAASSSAVLLAFSLTACGGGASDAPDDASKDDFCKAYNATSDLGDDASAEDQVEEAQDQAEKIIDVGTPEGISDDEREGFEFFVDAVKDINEDDVEKFTKAESEDEFKDAIGASDDDFKKVTAFLQYAVETCAEAPAE
jgi:hypothetical protein